jgi:integrase
MRVQGEGSIYQRTDGRWVASIQVAGKRYTFYAKSRTEAADKLQEARRQKAQATLVVPSRLKVGEYLERWLESVQLTRKPTTISCYSKMVRAHLIPALGSLPLQRVSPLHLIRLYETKAQGGTAARRASLIHEVLHAALADAVRWGLVTRNVAAAVPSPSRERTEPAMWSVQQARQFLIAAQVSPLQYAPATVIALCMGLRASELLGLRWESVDGDHERIVIDRALTWAGGRAVWVSPKSKAGRRVLPLPEPARQALATLRDRQAQHRSRAGDGWRDSGGRVVTTRTGGVPTLNRLKATVNSICRVADVPRLTMHQLRHQCASLLFAMGADVKSVQRYLGHSRPSITLDVYTHLLPGSDADMAKRLEQALE